MIRGPAAILALEDGTVLRGTAFGAPGEAFGEAVFNTGMSGYQEVLTDPSYAGQIVTMTAPHQGNHGANDEDPESGRIQVAGFAVREAARRPSSWRSRRSLHEDLARAGVVGIEGIDTRRLTLRIRERGAMRCAVSTEDLDAGSLVDRVLRSPGMEGADLARHVSAEEPYEAREVVGPARAERGPVFQVAAYDFGLKRAILRRLADAGIEATVFPATTPAAEIRSAGFHGVFLSNGPGDPAATGYGIAAARELLGRLPILGICLGHQLLGLALGGRTYKMPFGHRGANQPVQDLRSGRVEITSHNHGFAVDPNGWDGGGSGDGGGVASAPGSPPPLADVVPAHGPIARGDARGGSGDAPAETPTVATDLGEVELTHWNLNDGTLEGLRCVDVPALGVQYHPEAAPGPHDSSHVFEGFRALMGS